MTERRLTRVSLLVPQAPWPDMALGAEADGERVFPAVIIREGVYVPGIGNPNGERFFLSKEFLAKVAPSGEGKRVDLDHSDKPEDEVGVMRQVGMEEAAMRANLHLQANRPRFADAISFVEGRLKAKRVPNVSIELENIVTRPAKTPEEKAAWDHAAIDATMEGVAILPLGACSDKAGCGIGLAAKQAGFTVLALQGGDNRKDKPMCNDPNMVVSLQAEKKALEDRLKEKETALAEAKAQTTTLTNERDTLKATAAEREKQDIEDLTEAVKDALPQGTELATVVGDKPTVASLTVALKALTIAKPAPSGGDGKPAVRLGGRTTAPSTRSDAPSGADRDARVKALRLKHGLPEKSNLPPSMRRNSEARLLAQAEDAE
ncbi:MAG: phage scaffolding protein [Halobacteriales archaeon]|nr:phage scaffolding protein [Halobacteriales archaeon]